MTYSRARLWKCLQKGPRLKLPPKTKERWGQEHLWRDGPKVIWPPQRKPSFKQQISAPPSGLATQSIPVWETWVGWGERRFHWLINSSAKFKVCVPKDRQDFILKLLWKFNTLILCITVKAEHVSPLSPCLSNHSGIGVTTFRNSISRWNHKTSNRGIDWGWQDGLILLPINFLIEITFFQKQLLTPLCNIGPVSASQRHCPPQFGPLLPHCIHFHVLSWYESSSFLFYSDTFRGWGCGYTASFAIYWLVRMSFFYAWGNEMNRPKNSP